MKDPLNDDFEPLTSAFLAFPGRFSGRLVSGSGFLGGFTVGESEECGQRSHESPVAVLEAQYQRLVKAYDQKHDSKTDEKDIQQFHFYSFTLNLPFNLLMV